MNNKKVKLLRKYLKENSITVRRQHRYISVYLLNLSNMQSHAKKPGHERRQSYGKIMPISTMLNTLMTGYENDAKDNDKSSPEAVFQFGHLNASTKVHTDERSDGNGRNQMGNLTFNFIEHEKLDDQRKSEASVTQEIDINNTFLKCVNYHHRDSVNEQQPGNNEQPNVPDIEDDIDRILSNSKTPCPVCSNSINANKAVDSFGALCDKLCDDSCKSSANRKQNSIDKCDSHTKIEGDRLLARSDSNRQQFMANMLAESNDNEDDEDDEDDNDALEMASIEAYKGSSSDEDTDATASPLTVENLKHFSEKYFREKLAVAEALANTSMMTSPAVQRRLAARKIEMSIKNPDFVYDEENAEYVPPKELLMYLVR